MTSAITGVIGTDAAVPTQALNIPGMPPMGIPQPAGALSVPTLATGNYRPKHVSLANEFVHRAYTMANTGAEHEKTFGWGQLMFLGRSMKPDERGLYHPKNLQQVNYELETGIVPGVRGRKKWTQTSIANAYNWSGVYYSEGVGGALQEITRHSARVISKVVMGFTDRLANVFGENIRPKTRLFLICKKVRLSRQQREVITPSGRVVRQRTPDEPSVFQFVPFGDYRYDYPPLSAITYIEDDPEDEDYGAEKYGFVLYIGHAGVKMPEYTNPKFMQLAHRDATIVTRHFEAYIRQ